MPATAASCGNSFSSARAIAPQAGARSNFIVGFPGESRADYLELERFLTQARLDAVGVFDYSDEDGTEAAGMTGKLSAATVKRRYEKLSALVEELCTQRAEERLGSQLEVLVDSVADGVVEGRAEHQAPEVDGSVTLTGALDLAPGDLVRAVVTGTEGVDLVARATELISAARPAGAPEHAGSLVRAGRP